MTDEGKTAFGAAIFTGAVLWAMVKWLKPAPSLTYQWQGSALQFNLSGFGQTINGTIDMATQPYQQLLGGYLFTAAPEQLNGAVASYTFSILKDNQVLFSQSPVKWS